VAEIVALGPVSPASRVAADRSQHVGGATLTADGWPPGTAASRRPVGGIVRRIRNPSESMTSLRPHYALIAVTVLGTIATMSHPGSRGWVLATASPDASGPGSESITVEDVEIQRGLDDAGGELAERMRVRFAVRNTGRGIAQVDGVVIGYHPFPRTVGGGGNYTDIWLDDEVLIVSDDGRTRTFRLYQRDAPRDAYQTQVRAYVEIFGGCGHDELIELRPSGRVAAGSMHDFELNLPAELKVVRRVSDGLEDDGVEVDASHKLFQPQQEALPEMCHGAPAFFSITVMTTGGKCETVVVDAEYQDQVDSEEYVQYAGDFFQQLCDRSFVREVLDGKRGLSGEAISRSAPTRRR
jgi:hypothetical protein